MIDVFPKQKYTDAYQKDRGSKYGIYDNYIYDIYAAGNSSILYVSCKKYQWTVLLVPVIFFIYGQAGNMLLFFYLLHLQFILHHLLCIKTAKQRKKR